MLELLSRDRVQNLALVPDQPSRLASRTILTLQWTVDAETRRPVSRWAVSNDCGATAQI
jgi:hypothetical protein